MSTRVGSFMRGNLLGLVAIFIALGGTAYAVNDGTAPRNSVTSRSIKNGNVKLGDLAANSVDSSKVVDDALTGADINESTLQGIQGAQGATGPQGDVGPPGSPHQLHVHAQRHRNYTMRWPDGTWSVNVAPFIQPEFLPGDPTHPLTATVNEINEGVTIPGDPDPVHAGGLRISFEFTKPDGTAVDSDFAITLMPIN